MYVHTTNLFIRKNCARLCSLPVSDNDNYTQRIMVYCEMQMTVIVRKHNSDECNRYVPSNKGGDNKGFLLSSNNIPRTKAGVEYTYLSTQARINYLGSDNLVQ